MGSPGRMWAGFRRLRLITICEFFLVLFSLFTGGRVEWGMKGWNHANIGGTGARYPPKMIPYIDVIVHTTATKDKDARLLLSSMGVPFYGKHVN